MDFNDQSGDPTLTINNTQIYNSSNVGLLARTGHIVGENVVINNAGEVSLYCSLGGNYTFNHCTFANYSRFASTNRSTPSVLIDNIILADDIAIVEDLEAANFNNCIIYGDQNIELLFINNENALFNYNFKNCLIQFDDVNNSFVDNPSYDFDSNPLFENTILNEDPDFKDPTESILNIGEASAANGQASTPTSGTDILGTERNTTAPDIGAYESILFDQEN